MIIESNYDTNMNDSYKCRFFGAGKASFGQ